ncbi:Pre-mRNA splicing, partial [Linderina macrospora]
MPEEFTEEQQKLYQYAGNSGLVLQSDRSGLARRGERGKEIESLYGKIDGREMGSNVRHEAPPKAPKQGKTTEDEVRSIERKRNRREQRSLRTNYGYSNILAATDDIDGLAYRPKSRETRRVWDLILAQSRKYLGDQAPEVLVSAADEALAVLKNDDIREREQKKQVEALFGTTVPETDFALFVQLAKQITDYEDEPESMDVDGARPDAQSGVAVVFDGSEDEEGGRYAVDGESSDSDSDDEEDDRGPMPPDTGSDAGSVQSDGEAGGYRTVIHGYGDRTARKPNQHSAEQAAALTAAAASKTTSYGKPSAEGDSDTEMAGTEASSGQLSARSIDAFWLQRQVGKHFPDHMVVQDKTRNTLRLMANRRLAQSELENELAELFDYDHFDTVQVLVQNRELIVWGMKLARAEAEADSQQLADIEEEMRESGLGWIIDARDGVEKPQQQQSKQQPSQQRQQQQRSTDQDTEMDVDVETKAAEPKDYVPKEAIDLASLAFTQGGHLMTNERWVPPKGAEKIVMPGYEEIRVPAPERPPPPGDDEPTVSIGDMPKWSRSAFPGAKELNRVQ